MLKEILKIKNKFCHWFVNMLVLDITGKDFKQIFDENIILNFIR